MDELQGSTVVRGRLGHGRMAVLEGAPRGPKFPGCNKASTVYDFSGPEVDSVVDSKVWPPGFSGFEVSGFSLSWYVVAWWSCGYASQLGILSTVFVASSSAACSLRPLFNTGQRDNTYQ